MSDRCYRSQGYHIPGCYGCAVYGHHRCTCPPTDSPSLVARIERLERLLSAAPREGAADGK